MTAVTLAQADGARCKLREQLAGVPGIQGIGIAVLDGGYGVKVNVRDHAPRDVPDDVDGVPVVVEVVGIISAW
jgi:hypothetical protein